MKNLGPLALLAAVAAGAIAIFTRKEVVAPGEVVASGERKAGTPEQLFEWRVVGSAPGQEFPLTGQAKVAGFGSWTAETIVAMGPDKSTTVSHTIAYLAGL